MRIYQPVDMLNVFKQLNSETVEPVLVKTVLQSEKQAVIYMIKNFMISPD
jgi:hypothetical protein